MGTLFKKKRGEEVISAPNRPPFPSYGMKPSAEVPAFPPEPASLSEPGFSLRTRLLSQLLSLSTDAPATSYWSAPWWDLGRLLRAAGPALPGTQVCVAQESSAIACRGQDSPIGLRAPNTPGPVEKGWRAGWAAWEGKCPPGGEGLSPWEVPPYRNGALGAKPSPSAFLCPHSVCRFVHPRPPTSHPPMPGTLPGLGRDPSSEDRSPHSESEPRPLLPARGSESLPGTARPRSVPRQRLVQTGHRTSRAPDLQETRQRSGRSAAGAACPGRPRGV